MFLLIIFLTNLNASFPNNYKSKEIGTYKSELACMRSGEDFVKKHKKPYLEVTYTCEIDKNEGVTI